MSYGQVDRLAKLVPEPSDRSWTLERSLNASPSWKRNIGPIPDVKRLFDLAMKLEGLPRTARPTLPGSDRDSRCTNWCRSIATRARTCP
jgi:hypothetical protein